MRKLIVAFAALCAASVLSAQNLVPFEEGDKWGYKDPSTGSVVVPARYSKVSRFADGYGVVYDVKKGLAGLVDASGKEILTPCYTYIDLCNEGFAAVYAYSGKSKETSDVWSKGVWSYIHLSNPSELYFGDVGFDFVGPFVDGVAWVCVAETNTERAVRYMPIMDKKGKKELGREYIFGVSGSFKMEDLYEKDEDGNCIFYDGQWILVDSNKQVRTGTDRPYQRVGAFEDGLAWVKRDGKYGFVNVLGEEVIPVKYKAVQGCPDAIATSLRLNPAEGAVRWVMDDKGRLAWLNEKGNVVIDFIETDGSISIGSYVRESMWDF